MKALLISVATASILVSMIQMERFVSAKIDNDTAIARDTRRLADAIECHLLGGKLTVDDKTRAKTCFIVQVMSKDEQAFLERGRRDLDELAAETAAEIDAKLCAAAIESGDRDRVVLACPKHTHRSILEGLRSGKGTQRW